MNLAEESKSQEGKRKFRRPYKVDLFPEHVQSLVFRGFIRGDAYWKIRAAVKQAGFNISENALCRYWRNVWHEQVNRIRKARAYKEVLKEALQLDPTSDNSRVAEELLYSIVFQMMDYLEKEKPLDLLRAARELQKALPREKKPTARTSALAEARTIRHRWRELYGVEAGEEPDEKEEP